MQEKIYMNNLRQLLNIAKAIKSGEVQAGRFPKAKKVKHNVDLNKSSYWI